MKQVLSGRSGQLVLPAMGNTMASLAAMPSWYQYRLRLKNEKIMTRFEGRKVVEDLDKFYGDREREKEREEVGESAVLVPGN